MIPHRRRPNDYRAGEEKEIQMKIIRTGAVTLFMVVSLLFCGFSQASDTTIATELPIVIQGDEKLKSILEEALKEGGLFVGPGGVQKYRMRTVKPDPSIDYLIVKITPDPGVDYKIGIVDPEAKGEASHLPPEILEEILKQLKKITIPAKVK